jgi:hypothetical protein
MQVVKRKWPSFVCLWLMAFLSSVLPVAPQDQRNLDLTNLKLREMKNPPRAGTMSVSGTAVEGQTPAAASLRVGLTLENSVLRRNGQFIFAIELQNVSNKPILIPWDPQSADIEPANANQNYEFEKLAVSLNLQAKSRGSFAIQGNVELYSSSKRPSSSIVLRPTERAHLRARANLSAVNAGFDWHRFAAGSNELDSELVVTTTFLACKFIAEPTSPKEECSSVSQDSSTSNSVPVKVILAGGAPFD